MKKLTAVIAALMIMICGCAGCFAEQETISQEKALHAALFYAGLQKDQISLTRAHLDRDDGRQSWEIEFSWNEYEYEFNVDAMDGTILDADRERGDVWDWDDDWFDFD